MGLRLFEPCDDPAGVGCTIFEDPENFHLAEKRLAQSDALSRSLWLTVISDGILHPSEFRMVVS